MSSGGQESRSFFHPLVGRTATFLLDGRQANFEFARTVVGLLANEDTACTILDLDAFYSSYANLIFVPLSGGVKTSLIRVPLPGSDIEMEFSRLFEAQQKVVIIDSLNSLYHLISMEDGSSRGRKLNFALASLSYLARANAKAVILSMYRREGLAKFGASRSISDLSDLTASVNVRDREITIRVERGSAWPGGMFSIRIP